MDLANHPRADEIRRISREIAALAWRAEPDTAEWDKMLERVDALLRQRRRLYETGRALTEAAVTREGRGVQSILELMAERDRLKGLLTEILPGAMWASCSYKEHPNADHFFHCCDWNEVVERIQAVLKGGTGR